MMAATRVSIRRHTYRGTAGFLVIGSGTGIFGTRIFCETRGNAEYIKRLVKAGVEVELEDFSKEWPVAT